MVGVCRFHRLARRHRARGAVSRLQGAPAVLQTLSLWLHQGGHRRASLRVVLYIYEVAHQNRSHQSVLPAQIIVLDKLDYCATLRNLESVKDHKNMKVRIPTPPPATQVPLHRGCRVACWQATKFKPAMPCSFVKQPPGGGSCPSATATLALNKKWCNQCSARQSCVIAGAKGSCSTRPRLNDSSLSRYQPSVQFSQGWKGSRTTCCCGLPPEWTRGEVPTFLCQEDEIRSRLQSRAF